MSQEINLSWAEANRSYLVAEFARLREQLSGGGRGPMEPANYPHEDLEAPLAIDRITELLGLSPFEREILLLCAGIEMDSELASLCTGSPGGTQRPYATFGLALGALTEPHWSALTPARPLRRFRLVTLEPGQGLTSAPIRIDEPILHYLAGVNFIDPQLEPILKVTAAGDWIAASHQLTAGQAARILGEDLEDPPVLHLCGDDPAGQEDVAALAARNIGGQLFTLRIEDLPSTVPDLDQFLALWRRQSLLTPGALLLQCGSAALNGQARNLIERLQGPVFVASRDLIRINRPFVRFEVTKPEPAEQKLLWQQALGPAAESFNGTIDSLSEQFRLSARMIHSTGSPIASGKVAARAADLWNSCRSMARPKMEDLAQRIVPAATWDDLVLPELQQQMLLQLAAQVRYRMQVYETWGFSDKGRRGLGVSALFTGESGTGKTLAGEVVAHDLGLDVYRIDLSAVVSKYIGETEKNLRQVFDAAEEGGVLLLFDEADALFGKRADVKDSHDRYANIEVGYLLQRMEAYQGVAILTTNLKSSLDKAFQRRLRFTVNFPFPDAAQREAIWSKAFPAATPTRDLDLQKLAQLKVTGGNIRNIALNAAFLAARAGTPVDMASLAEAAEFEAHKVERPLTGAELRGWV